MENKQTLSRSIQSENVLENVEYYKYIFKKTEKIACAVFYILRSDQVIRQDDVVVTDLENSSRTILNVSLISLRSTVATIEEQGLNLKYALIDLESRLRVAHAARILSPDLLEVFVHEIDSVLRLLKKYIEPSTKNPLLEEIEISSVTVREKERRVPRVQQNNPIREVLSSGGAIRSRRDRVMDVLRDKTEATIKDIIEVITDCSEKTIQRELIALIKDNLVIREGERRWSKYKLV